MNMIDVKASVKNGERLRAFNAWNKEMPVIVKGVGQSKDSFQLPPMVRVIVPTSTSLDGPAKVYIDPDAGLKKALGLVLGTQIVTGPTESLELYIQNNSDSLVTITDGETLAQAELAITE
jgi:hypothetical protein